MSLISAVLDWTCEVMLSTLPLTSAIWTTIFSSMYFVNICRVRGAVSSVWFSAILRTGEALDSTAKVSIRRRLYTILGLELVLFLLAALVLLVSLAGRDDEADAEAEAVTFEIDFFRLGRLREDPDIEFVFGR